MIGGNVAIEPAIMPIEKCIAECAILLFLRNFKLTPCCSD
jgi:hypothetical protein